MKLKTFLLGALLLAAQSFPAFACSACYGNYGPGGSGSPPPTMQHMALAIWFMIAATMSVLGGVGAFGFHLWRHARMPLEPHQELAQEDLNAYD